MEVKKSHTIIAIAIGLGILGLGYWYSKRSKSGDEGAGHETSLDNFDDLMLNLGDAFNRTEYGGWVYFNAHKNTAKFYKNNRIHIYKVIDEQAGKVQEVLSGTYTNGGKTFSMDNGKILTSDSVWQNLLDSIK